MNRSQIIKLDAQNVDNDKYIRVKLEQNVDTLEFLTMKITTSDTYKSFNSDYGVLIGRVVANGGVGIQNVKISIFIPLTEEDSLNADIYSVYPYSTPRDKNNEGKRYNLLPRVSQFDQVSGVYKPKQPFGSFPTKPEIVTNEPLLNVYKKYYKYTALTNSAGDYMIFGVPTGTQTVHMSVDITDIGKYSMSPSSMVIAGYPPNLFTDATNAIKPSIDLDDLPNIETQEISVDIIPFWGDTTNFEIGITRQDFRVKASLVSNFTIFGTSMTMGQYGVFGSGGNDYGFYSLNPQNIFSGIDANRKNASDIRTYRVAEPEIRIFTYNTDIPIKADGTLDLPSGTALQNTPVTYFDENIRELDPSEYFVYNVGGQFLFNVPCNRAKIITGNSGEQIPVADDSSYGIFTKFFGMMLVKYPNLPISSSGGDYSGKHSSHDVRGWFKIPQSLGLREPDDNYTPKFLNNNEWRKAYQTFTGGGIYSVAQFYPAKLATGTDGDHNGIEGRTNTTNMFKDNQDYYYTAGAWFKVEGNDILTQTDYDNNNYIEYPTTGVSTNVDRKYKYDLSPNVDVFSTTNGGDSFTTSDKFFGGQWLNFCLFFPQYQWAYDSGKDRSMSWADVYHMDPQSSGEYFVTDNKQTIFAGIKNSKYLLRGDAFSTAFINIPRGELTKLLDIPHKGINISRYNTSQERWAGVVNKDTGQFWTAKPTADLSTTPYKYLPRFSSSLPSPGVSGGMNGQNYTGYYWNSSTNITYAKPNGFNSYESTYAAGQVGSNKTAFIFKGMYENDCIQLLSDFNII